MLPMPREYLNPRHGGSSDLRGRLLNDCRLDIFCDQVIDTELVRDVLLASDNHAVLTALVAKITPMERTPRLWAQT